MKEKLYTIPVNEAFDRGGECPFCNLQKKLESDILNYVLGPSYMEEDVRGETDRLGFCKEHYRQMFQAGNRLGLALMLDTHLKKINGDLEKILEEEEKNAAGKRSLFKKETGTSPFEEYEETLKASCYACRRMEGRMDSYVDTFFHLWKTEPEFREKVKGGQGFCLEHFQRLLREGKQRLSAGDYRAFLELLIPIEKENLKRVEEELDWFIQKFDYRFKDEPWKNSKDAVERGILKVAAAHMGEPEKLQ